MIQRNAESATLANRTLSEEPTMYRAAVIAVCFFALACGSSEVEAPMTDAAPVGEEGGAPTGGAGSVVRVDDRLDALVPPDATIEKVADGFLFTEGPVWLKSESRLLFSDVRDNTIYQWTESEGASVFMKPVYEGDMEGRGSVGSNGLTLDAEGRLVMAEHGYRQVSRLEEDGSRTVLVDNHEGARLNSPNDLVFGSDGSLYFTDPPYGLADAEESPLRELDVNGIYRLRPSGALELLYAEQSRPNGIALSPDESTLYVANSDGNQAVWMAYDLDDDGVSNPRVFYDVTAEEATGAPDGMKVDVAGNIFATGPGGVRVFDPDGTHLGTIQPTEVPANVAWGDDGRTLYMTARTGLYRVRLTTEGAIPGP